MRQLGVRALLSILLLLLLVGQNCCSSFGPVAGNFLPNLNLNPFTSRQSLREECEARSPSSASICIWADEVTQGYEVAATIFDFMLTAAPSSNATDGMIWLPEMKGREATQMLSDLVEILNGNAQRLGGWTASVETWPRVPTTGISLKVESAIGSAQTRVLDATNMRLNDAVTATDAWVNNTLGRLGLCPYTSSMSRAAIGLEFVGVESGPVIVRHSIPPSLCSDGDSSTHGIAVPPTDAVILSASFWNSVVDLASRPETKVATFLLVAPPAYDEDFDEFVATCDELVGRSCKAVAADDIIGKAWFHPHYNSDVVGQDQILPGHALPATMVKEFADKYFKGENLDLAAVSRANDAVRHTPHATVNLLRRSQLRASKEAEVKQGRNRPNYIYAQNVVRLLSSEDK